MIDPAFLKQIDKFKLLLKKKTNSKYKGEEQSKASGEGLIFKEFREYVPGDDIRYIDWKVYARTDKFFIREFEEEKSMIFHIILDASHSMDFGNPSKFEYAAKIAIGLAYLASKQNQKFEFSVFSDKLQHLNGRKSNVMKIIDDLNSKKPKNDTKFGNSMENYDKKIKSKSFIVIVSDFLFDADEISKVLNKLKKNDVLLIQVMDEKERLLQYYGDSILKDSESGLTVHTYISQRLRKSYIEELQEHIDDITLICSKLNINFLTTTNNVPFFETFFHVFKSL